MNTFNKTQRNQLDALSEELYGARSTWRKLLKDPRFKKVTEVVEDARAQTYVQVANRKGGRAGTRYRTDTAIRLGIVPADYKAPVVKKTKTEDLSFEEVVEALESSLETAYLSVMTKEGQTLTFARQFLDKTLKYKLALLTTEDTKEAFESLRDLLDDDLKARVDEIVKHVDNDTAPDAIDAIPLAADAFLGDLVFVRSNRKEADIEIASFLESAKEAHQLALLASKRMESYRERLKKA
jgi:hypothetical protein